MTSMWRHHVKWTPIWALNVAKNAFHKYLLTDYLAPRSLYTGLVLYPISYPISYILYPISYILYPIPYLSHSTEIVSWWTSKWATRRICIFLLRIPFTIIDLAKEMPYLQPKFHLGPLCKHSGSVKAQSRSVKYSFKPGNVHSRSIKSTPNPIKISSRSRNSMSRR